MNHFKKKTNKSEKLRGIYFQIGLIIAGGLTLVAFEWMSPVNIATLPPVDPGDEVAIDFPIILPEKKIEKPEVKKTTTEISNEIIKIVKNTFEPDPEPTPEPTPDPEFTPDPDPEPTSLEPDAPFVIVEKMPEFVGGLKKMRQFLGKNLKYPEIDKQGDIQGTVYLKFVINKKGEIKNVEVLRGVSPTLDREALRVVKSMPNWKPGKQRGKTVSVIYNLPIRFKLH